MFKGQDTTNAQKYSNLVILCDEFDLLPQAEKSNEIVTVIYPCRVFLYKCSKHLSEFQCL